MVERRDRALDAGIDALAARLSAGPGRVAELPARLIRALAPEGTDDDIAILIARVADAPAQQTATFELPPSAEALQDGRRFAAAALARWSLPDAPVQDATLVVSELLSNALIHGRPPIRLRLRLTRRELAIEVDGDSSAMPRKLRPPRRPQRPGAGHRRRARHPLGRAPQRARQDGLELAPDPELGSRAPASGFHLKDMRAGRRPDTD